MKKKVVSLLLVGVLAMSTFVGCGSKGSSDAKTENGSSDDSSSQRFFAALKNRRELNRPVRVAFL